MTPFDAEPEPRFALWHRLSRRCKWRVVGRGDTALEALRAMAGRGEWMLIGDGYDPNQTTLADAQRRAEGDADPNDRPEKGEPASV